jgi:FlaA1/EpsC-like NDP-sugar epimerase
MLIPGYNRVASRWLIFGLELVLAHLAFMCSVLVAGRFGPATPTEVGYAGLSVVNAAISSACMMVLRTHVGIIRFSSSRDLLTVVQFGVLQFLLWTVLQMMFPDILPVFPPGGQFFLVNAVLASLFIITARILIKEVFSLGGRMSRERVNVLVYGADDHGHSALQAIEGDRKLFRNVVGFIDPGKDRIGKAISGRKVMAADKATITRAIRQHHVRELILADGRVDERVKSELLNICNEQGIRLATIPPISAWVDGSYHPLRIRDMTIESVLDREAITLDNERTSRELNGTTVLVTGAAGSIGGELCAQLCRHGIRRLVMLDVSETGLHDALRRLRDADTTGVDLVIELANIRDKERVERILDQHRPHLLYHAAAYKHVPILEAFPREALMTNVLGTKTLADAAIRTGVRTFVMISTDKAVNPTNIMGASKRLAEIYVNALGSTGTTHFITTRFGNVLASNGSVVPIFRSQIDQGGPVTVTHPDITRYFMTIPEASSLVIEASIMGQGGEIYVFDMGKPVRILDMARKMIQLAGFRPEIDVRIEFSGLRKGEKLHEELFRLEENPLPTHHPKILKARHQCVPDAFLDILEELRTLLVAPDCDPQALRGIIRRVVPEYVYEGCESAAEAAAPVNGSHENTPPPTSLAAAVSHGAPEEALRD